MNAMVLTPSSSISPVTTVRQPKGRFTAPGAHHRSKMVFTKTLSGYSSTSMTSEPLVARTTSTLGGLGARLTIPMDETSASHFGGTRNGLAISWPNNITDAGGVRSQFHHVVDIAPTIYAAAGITPPERVNGIEQMELDGVPMNYTFRSDGESAHLAIFRNPRKPSDVPRRVDCIMLSWSCPVDQNAGIRIRWSR